MGSIRLIQKPVNGQIVFNVPDDMRDETIVIDFHPVQKDRVEIQHHNPGLAESSKAFFEKLNRVKTDFNEEDYNVYEQ